MEHLREVDTFLEEWKKQGQVPALWFEKLYQLLAGDEEVTLSFHERPGISYSLRPQRKAQNKPLFALIDVIDDDPADRWLSVCFYEEFITDTNQLGQIVPGGLLGEDGYCFDIMNDNDFDYVKDRIIEARQAAS